jgi:hypothetical protein
MSKTIKIVVAAVALLVLVIAAVPLAPLMAAALPALFAPLSAGDGGAVFVAVAGAFGLAFVLAVPRQR